MFACACTGVPARDYRACRGIYLDLNQSRGVSNEAEREKEGDGRRETPSGSHLCVRCSPVHRGAAEVNGKAIRDRRCDRLFRLNTDALSNFGGPFQWSDVSQVPYFRVSTFEFVEESTRDEEREPRIRRGKPDAQRQRFF